MRLVTFKDGDGQRIGVEMSDGGDVADITKADAALPKDMKSLLAMDGGVAAAKAAIEKAPKLKAADVTLQAVIYDVEKIICIGMNYVDHCTEQNMPVPKEPVVFSKFASTITEPGSPIILAPEVDNLDFEVELAIVVGKTAKRVSKADAMDYVAGFTVAHDVSARCWQLKRNGGQWLMGKSMDTFSPIGPAIVTTDEIGETIHNKRIACRLNGETVQDSNTNQLVFDVPTIIEWCSAMITLKPGDLIFTGTPPGVGCFRNPPLWLKAGDVVDCEIEGIGTITNPVKAEDVPEGKRLKKAE